MLLQACYASKQIQNYLWRERGFPLLAGRTNKGLVNSTRASLISSENDLQGKGNEIYVKRCSWKSCDLWNFYLTQSHSWIKRMRERGICRKIALALSSHFFFLLRVVKSWRKLNNAALNEFYCSVTINLCFQIWDERSFIYLTMSYYWCARPLAWVVNPTMKAARTYLAQKNKLFLCRKRLSPD